MKASIWTGFFLLHEGNNIEDAFEILGKSGYTCAELDEVTIKTFLLNEPAGNYLKYGYHKSADFLQSLGYIQNLCSKHNVSITQMHAPAPVWNREKQEKITDILAQAADSFGCKTIVIHPYTGREEGFPGLNVTGFSGKDWSVYYKWLYNQTAGMLETVCKTAKKHNVNIALENQIDVKGIGGRWIGGHPQDMEELFSNFENLGLNLDFAHACAQQLDVADLINWAGSKLFGLHVSDSDGLVRDFHVMPGKGILNWNDIMKALGKSSYSGDFNLEIVNERKATAGLSFAAAIEAKAITDKLLKIA